MNAGGAGVCRSCGCTDLEPCILGPDGNVVAVIPHDTLPDGYSTCSWIEPDLCSGCVQTPAPPLLFDRHGRPLRGAP